MGFISKVELRYQLRQMGIKVEGNYVKKSDIERIVTAGTIDVETFLLGGEFGNPYNRRLSEGFHCLVKHDENDDALASFAEFKKTIKILLEDFAWDIKENTTVDRPGAPYKGIQEYKLPSDTVLKKWYTELLQAKKEYNHIYLPVYSCFDENPTIRLLKYQ